MGNNYSAKDYNKENMARAFGRSLPISFKQSVEICNFIRNKNVNYVKDILSDIVNQKEAVPFRRFNTHIGHKKKIMAGRYPKKASTKILNLINHVEANAQFKGLNTANLVITHINANKASKVMHSGRKRSIEAKRTNVEIIVQEESGKKHKEVKSEEKETKVQKRGVMGKSEVEIAKKENKN